MKRLVKVTLLIAFTGFLSYGAFGQRKNAAEVTRIDKYCKSLDYVTKKLKGPELVFADISDYNEKSRPRWRKFASEKALEKFRESSETYTNAYVWRKGGKVAIANFTLYSPSGDWTKYVYSYFRPDGTLARVESELRTFFGDYIVIRRRYFNPSGRLIRTSNKYLYLQSGKPKKPTPEYIDEKFAWSKGDYFKRAANLPFARLLKTAADYR